MADLHDVASSSVQVDVTAFSVEFESDMASQVGVGLPDPANMNEMRQAPDCKEFEIPFVDEFQSIQDKGVMIEIPLDQLPRGAKPLASRLIFVRKTGPDGEIVKHKARLVVLGNMSRPGVHFDPNELSAPTPAATSLRIMFAIAAQLGYHTRQIDIKTAFLNAPLREEVYITLPKGVNNSYTPDGKIRVFKLVKALYGLKQAPREWNTEFDGTLRDQCGFTRLKNESCIYIYTTRSGKPLLLCLC